MPAAIVLRLRAERGGALYGATGQHVHGFWLNSWRRVDPAVGDALHDERKLRPFTLSPLLGLARPLRGRTAVGAGAQAWLRVCALDETTQAQLLETWLPGAPRHVTLGGLPWELESVAISPDDHPDAGWERFATLRDRYADDAPARWALRFDSPAAVHQRDGTYVPFPLPQPLVMTWLDRWRECAGPNAALPALDVERLGERLRVSEYELKTVSARFWRRDATGRRREWPQIGCVGTLVLDGRRLSAEERAAVSSLVDFAFYCGSGHHTTMGMGQTRGEGQ